MWSSVEAKRYEVTLEPMQDDFCFSSARYPAFIGGIGSGKTYAGSVRAVTMLPRGDGMIVAPTYPMLRDATEHTFFAMLNDAGIPYELNKSEQTAIVNQKTRILFRSADKPDRLRGPNLTWAWLDEAAMMRRLVWDVVIGRLRVGETSAFVTGTPAGHNWLAELWQSGQEQYQLYRARTADNPHLAPEYLDDLRAAYSGAFARQELEGEFVQLEGVIYDEFRDETHVMEAEPGWEWPRYSAVDFGYTNPFVCLWGAVDGDGRLYVYDEHYKRRELIDYHATEIKRRGDVRWTVADHDAQGVAELRQAGVQTTPAKKAVIVGIRSVKARLQVQGDGRPRLYIHPRCVNLLREIGQYAWAETSAGEPKEQPVKENDHAMDALRYLVMQLSAPVTPLEFTL